MSIELLTSREKEEVEKSVNGVAGKAIMNELLESRLLVKLQGRRIEILFVTEEQYSIWKKIAHNLKERRGTPVHLGIKLGFLISGKFRIGIESLSFLSPLISRKLILTQFQSQRFFYGRNVAVTNESLQKQIRNFDYDFPFLIESHDNIPIGFARVVEKDGKKILQNLVDIGIFLRSEKTAF